jgi:hypothetical protein
LYLDETSWNCHAFTVTEARDQTRQAELLFYGDEPE